jgi:hypothetical protein
MAVLIGLTERYPRVDAKVRWFKPGDDGAGRHKRLGKLRLGHGLEFNLAYIPDEFHQVSQEDFDPVYMGKLFDLAYRQAMEGYPWAKAPPGFE